jgi:hypothetical protein
MEMKEKISLMLKCALEYNSAVVSQAVLLYANRNTDRKATRDAIKNFRKLQDGYMKQLDQILTGLEVEVS